MRVCVCVCVEGGWLLTDFSFQNVLLLVFLQSTHTHIISTLGSVIPSVIEENMANKQVILISRVVKVLRIS